MKLLMEILEMRRPHGGVNELKVAEEIVARLPKKLSAYMDNQGKPMAFIYITDPESTTLFVSHLDTVHRDELTPNPVLFDEELEHMYKTDGTPLGADDGAGVWLLYKMALAEVPGTYLWTLGEERGGVGARWLADNATSFLSQFDRAISFDRKGTTSVITHQGWNGRCCSDDFGLALADQLGMEHILDSGGVYTDTAEFVNVIPECTNLSVGYHREHTGLETLDTRYLEDLLSACCLADWESLPSVRDPNKPEPIYSAGVGAGITAYDLELMDYDSVVDLVYEYPEDAVELLMSFKSTMPETSAWFEDVDELPTGGIYGFGEEG